MLDSDSGLTEPAATNPWNCDRLRTSLLAIARSLADRELGEDAVQEVLLAGWRKRHVIRNPAHWAARALRLQIAFARRGHRRRASREQSVAIPELLEECDEVLAREVLDAVREEAEALDEPYRTTIALRFFQELNNRQAADLEGVEEVTIRVRLSRALSQLRDRLERRGVRRRDLMLLLLFFSESAVAAGASISPTRLARSSQWAWLPALAVVSAILWTLLPAATPVGGRETSGQEERLLRSDPVATPEGEAKEGEAVVAVDSTDGSLAEGLVELSVRSRRGDPISSIRVEFFAPSLAAQHSGNGKRDLEFRISNPPSVWSQSVSSSSLVVPEELWRTHGVRVSAPGHFEFWDGPRIRALPATVELGPPITTAVHFQSEEADLTARVVLEGRSGHQRVFEHRTGDPLAVEVYETTLLRAIVEGHCAVAQLVECPEMSLVLLTGDEMTLQVVDEQGRPVQGCRVIWEASPKHGRQLDEELGPTDETGSIRFGPVPEAEAPRLRFEHPSHLAQRSTLESSDGVVALQTGWYVEGCADQQGSVVAFSESNPGAPDLTVTEVSPTGQFRLGPLPWKPHRLRLEPQGDFETLESNLVPPEAGTVANIHLSATRSARLMGRVRTERGEAVAGVQVTLGSVLGDEVRGDAVTAGPAGRLVFSNVPVGIPHCRTARARDFRWRHDAPTADALLLEVLPPHELLEVNGEPVPSVAHYGSRNTAWIRPDSPFVDVVVRTAKPEPTVRFEAIGPSGETIRTRMNLLMVNQEGWVVKTFAKSDGNLRRPLRREVCEHTTFVALPKSPMYAWSFLEANQFVFRKPFSFTLQIQTDEQQKLGPVYVSSDRLSPGAAYLGTLDEKGDLKIAVLGVGRYTLWTPRETLGRTYSGLPTDQLCAVGEFRVRENANKIVMRALPLPARETSEQ